MGLCNERITGGRCGPTVGMDERVELNWLVRIGLLEGFDPRARLVEEGASHMQRFEECHIADNQLKFN